jgi:hypothetical protein
MLRRRILWKFSRKWKSKKWIHVYGLVAQQPFQNLEDFLLKVSRLDLILIYILLEPKPARCFSILGLKSLKGQKTFNVECDKEEDCIKYVDYISILIQNYKSNKEDSFLYSNDSSLTGNYGNNAIDIIK